MLPVNHSSHELTQYPNIWSSQSSRTWWQRRFCPPSPVYVSITMKLRLLHLHVNVPLEKREQALWSAGKEHRRTRSTTWHALSNIVPIGIVKNGTKQNLWGPYIARSLRSLCLPQCRWPPRQHSHRTHRCWRYCEEQAHHALSTHLWTQYVVGNQGDPVYH